MSHYRIFLVTHSLCLAKPKFLVSEVIHHGQSNRESGEYADYRGPVQIREP